MVAVDVPSVAAEYHGVSSRPTSTLFYFLLQAARPLSWESTFRAVNNKIA